MQVLGLCSGISICQPCRSCRAAGSSKPSVSAFEAPRCGGIALPTPKRLVKNGRKWGPPGTERGQHTCDGFGSGLGPTAEQKQARVDSHGQASSSGRNHEGYHVAQLVAASPPAVRPASSREWQFLSIGALLALSLHVAIQWLLHLPFWQRLVQRFIWWKDGFVPGGPAGEKGDQSEALKLFSDNAESVEWFNMCWRKMWRVYQRGLERWLADLLQPVFDNLVAEVAVPRFVQRLRIVEFTLDHEAPTFSKMRRRSSRKDSDLNGVVNVRYTGGARMLLLIEVGQGRWRFKLPVLVSDLDLECKLWIKLRLAPMPPYIGTIALAFVGPPNIKVQLLPYNHVKLMRIPILQPFLTKLLTVDLPGLMVLPKRLEINIPPAVTAVAEAAVGHDAVMRAVASAVLQADALEHALMAALPLGPQSAAGGVSLPDAFQGELQVTLLEARNLPVWGFPWQSNPYCRLILGAQAVRSRRDDDTSHAGSHRAPVWNQEFQFLVEDPLSQVLEVHVRDSHLTGRADLGFIKFPLRSIPPDGHVSAWVPVQPWTPGMKAEGELHLQLTYKPFVDDEGEIDQREAEALVMMLQEQVITDVKSAADASSRAAVAASAAAAAVAVTKAAAARAAAKVALSAKARARQQRLGAEQESGKLLERRVSMLRDRDVAVSMDDGVLEEAASNAAAKALAGSAGTEKTPIVREDADGRPVMDPIALQDILPEDLFPPVSFSINENDDEDMPYTRPAPKQAEHRDDDSASPQPAGSAAAASERRSETDSSGSGGEGKAGGLAASDPEANAASTAVMERARREQDAGPSDAEKQVLGSRAFKDQEHIIAQAQAAHEQQERELSHVSGQGVDVHIPPLQGGAHVEVKGPPSEEDKQPSSKSEDGAAAEASSGSDKPGTFRSILARLPFANRKPEPVPVEELSDPAEPEQGAGEKPQEDSNAAEQPQEEEERKGILARVLSWRPFAAKETPKKSETSEERQAAVDADTIRKVAVDEVQLEAIAEEVQLSWRLKEIRAEQLMQKAVARSERPWLILLSSMFTATVVLLMLVLYRLYVLENNPLALLLLQSW